MIPSLMIPMSHGSDCQLRDHPQRKTVEDALTLGTMTEPQAALELGVSLATVQHHREVCMKRQEVVIDDLQGFDPYQQLQTIIFRMIQKANDMLQREEFTSKGEKLTNIIRETTNVLKLFNSMGRVYVPASEKELQQIKSDLEEFMLWIANPSNLCLECRVRMEETFYGGSVDGEAMGLPADAGEDSQDQQIAG